MKLFDLHCDTLYELYKRALPFSNDKLHITADTVSTFEKQTQVFAVWSEHSIGEEAAWEQFGKIIAYREALSFPDNLTGILAVEGGKLLAGKLSRIDRLREQNVKILTLVWQDACCMGGAWNTSDGLTAFGRAAVEGCFANDILPDLSHSSDEMAWETIRIAEKKGKPVIASHSCARRVFAHPRNLTDDMARALFQMGGLVGLSFAPQHLGGEEHCNIEQILRHLDHYLELGGEKSLCLGCDFDGVETLPGGIRNGAGLLGLADAMLAHGFGKALTEAIFYENAAAFFERSGILGAV